MPRLTPVHWRVLECIFLLDGFTFEEKKRKFILLHGFTRKKDKTPQREIETADERMKEI